MFCLFYDIIAKVLAAQRFSVSALLVAFGKCHERCGCVTFREIYEGGIGPERPPEPVSPSARQIDVHAELDRVVVDAASGEMAMV
jgi:hypothetical protein